MAVIIGVAWAPILMAAIFLGLHTPGEMAAVLIGLGILAAAALQAKLTGRSW
jgi:hypothetical protein